MNDGRVDPPIWVSSWRTGEWERKLVDGDLVTAAQNGDKGAYVDLIRARADHLFAVAHRILRDVDRAEDALLTLSAE